MNRSQVYYWFEIINSVYATVWRSSRPQVRITPRTWTARVDGFLVLERGGGRQGAPPPGDDGDELAVDHGPGAEQAEQHSR